MAILHETVQIILDCKNLLTGASMLPSTIYTFLAMMTGVLCYLYWPYWRVRRVPGPTAVPLVGHLPMLAKYGPDAFSILAKRYGPIYRFHMGRQPLIIVADPELCREVGIKKFKDIPNRSIPSPISACPLHQKGLFFTRDTRWSIMRNTILSLYQPSHLASLVPTMQAFIESATQNLHLNTEKDTNFSDLSLKLATDVIGQSAFGVDFGLSNDPSKRVHDPSHNDSQVSDFISQHIYSTTQLKMDLSGSFSIILGLLFPVLQEPCRHVLKRIPSTMDWKVDRSNKSLSGRLDGIIEKRMRERNPSSKDFLSLILKARDSETLAKDVFTPDFTSAVTYEHLLAGSATTAFTLSSILYLIAAHLEVENKLIEEIDGYGPHDLKPTAHDLSHRFPYLDQESSLAHDNIIQYSTIRNEQLTYAFDFGLNKISMQVIKEAMRFFTVSPLVARETSKQVEIGGYILPKGTWLWLALGVLAKDPKNFPEPDKFKPERFDSNCEEEKQRHPYAFVPFGIGPRACIGQKFALQEIKLTLIHLYRKYVFRHSPDMEKPVELEYGVVLNFKYGVRLRVIERQSKTSNME